MALHRHCERSEAIQAGSLYVPLDCFVATLLAMTGGQQPATHAPVGATAFRKVSISAAPASSAFASTAR